MEKVIRFSLMVPNMMGSFRMAKQLGQENSCMPMEMSMKDNGRITCQKVMASTIMQTVQSM